MIAFRLSSCLILLSTSLLGFSASAKEAPKQRKLFLSIGIGEFEDKRWPSLRFVESDAQRIHDALKPSFDGGILLTQSETKAKVTKADILKAIDRLSSEIKSEEDVVIIYFSGHGTLSLAPKPNAEGLGLRKFLVTSDSRFDTPSESALAIDDVLERFGKLKSRRKAIIIDSCYAGGGKAVLTPRIQALLAKQKAGGMQEPVSPLVESAAIYTASAWSEEAGESEQLKSGIYTHFLIEGFKKDLDGDGAVSLSEAHHYASNRVVDFTRNTQHPTAKVEYVGRDPVIVNGQMKGLGQSILYAWQFALRGYDVVLGKSPLGSLQSGALPVPEGYHTLRLVDPKSQAVILEKKVRFEPGKDYSISDFFWSEASNRLELEAGWFSFFGRSLEEEWTPSPWQGYQLRYTRKDFFHDWHLMLGLGTLGSSSDEVTLSLDQSQMKGKAHQSIEALRGSVSLADLTPLPSLSSREADFSMSYLASFGVEILDISRELKLNTSTALKKERETQVFAIHRSALQGEKGQFVFSLGADLLLGANAYTQTGSYALGWNPFLSLGAKW